jgi:hypothetical protein
MHLIAAKLLFMEDVATLSPALAERRGWIFHAIEYPLIDCAFIAPQRTPIRLRFTCDEWNDRPPSISFHAADGAALTVLPPNRTGVFHQGPHPITNRPFICMRGAREYHIHPSHVGDPWEPLKGHSSYTLGSILTQLWNAWQKGSG